jgi:hypothetical protein
MPRYLPREPEHDPELLAMEYAEEGFFYPGGLGRRRECGTAGCSELAVYEGQFSDASWIYLCAEHGEEEAEYAGLEMEADDAA